MTEGPAWPFWLRSRRIGTCAEADRGRRKNTMIFSGGAALSSPLLLLAVLEDPVILLAYLPLGGLFTIYAVSLIRLRHYMRAGRSLWSATESGVVMEVPRELIVLDPGAVGDVFVICFLWRVRNDLQRLSSRVFPWRRVRTVFRGRCTLFLEESACEGAHPRYG